MSKSKCSTLTNLDFERKEIAWELLRRIPEYRADWERYKAIVTKAKEKAGTQAAYSKGTKIYIPPMKPEDDGNYRKWFVRVFKSGRDPITTHAHLYYPRQWGLKRMIPYDQSYDENVIFTPVTAAYPVRIRQEEDLTHFLEETDYGDGSAIVNAVTPDIAVFAFDLTAPPNPQIDSLIEQLRQAYQESRTLHGVKRTSVPKKITEHIDRHIRILDLLLADPDMGGKSIAEALGYDETLTGTSAAQQGHRWKQQALYARDNYRLFLYRADHIKNSKNQV